MQIFAVLTNGKTFRATLLTLFCILFTFVQIPAKSFASFDFNFTTATATGRTGPTQIQVNSAYSGTNLAGLVTISTQGIQSFSVPYSGNWTITLAGSAGGSSAVTGGTGAVFTTNTISLTQNEVLNIGVGQKGLITSDGTGAGGGGASWVYRSSTSSLIAIAGGGGGGGVSGVINSGSNAPNAADGNGQAGASAGGQSAANGGTSGNGGTNNGIVCGLGWAGWLGSGPSSATCARTASSAAISISTSAIGGLADNTTGSGGNGGFGGGGGGAGSCGYGGGGGGYSGGGGGLYQGGCGGPGGGGGSFSNYGFTWVGTNSSAGYVKLSYLGTLNSTTSISLQGGVSTVSKRSTVIITASVSQPGTVTFYHQATKIPGCINVPVSGLAATCSWHPTLSGSQNIYAVLSPNNGYASSSGSLTVTTTKRTTSR